VRIANKLQLLAIVHPFGMEELEALVDRLLTEIGYAPQK
jgi:hypothetical protein